MSLPLHPQNQNFQWQAPSPPFRRISLEHAKAWNDFGWFVLDDLFDPETMTTLVAEIDPFEAKVEAFLRTRPEGKLFIARSEEITFTTHLVTHSKVLHEFVRGPVFQDLAHDLIGPDVRLYWDQAVYKKPGTRLEFPWHQDNAYTFLKPQQYVSCWIALTDATLENGCPWVVSGLHKLGTLLHRLTDPGWSCLQDPENAVAAPLRAGSVVVFSSLTPHRTGPNRSAATRKAYIVQIAGDDAKSLVPGAPEGEPQFQRCDAPDRQFFILKNGCAPE